MWYESLSKSTASAGGRIAGSLSKTEGKSPGLHEEKGGAVYEMV